MSTVIDSFPAPSHAHPEAGEPAWDSALMYPLQGHWSVDAVSVKDVFAKCEEAEQP